MLKTPKIVIQVIWAVSAVTLCAAIGADFGWQHHGWIGTIALGIVGTGVGAFIAASPGLLLQLLH